MNPVCRFVLQKVFGSYEEAYFMNWIKNHIKLTIIMIVILILVTIIVVSSFDSKGGSVFGNALQGTAAVAEEPLTAAGSGISSFFGGLINFRSIQKENYRLKQELEEVSSELTETQLTQIQLSELRELANSLNYSSYDDEYDKVTANVIAMDNSDIFNIFTINAGSDDGIEKDDMVVNADGLIGRVLSVSGNSAKVSGLVDSSNSVSFTVIRDPEILGIISGDGAGGLEGYIFDESKSIIEGDTIVTSGIGNYPAGIVIGEINAVNIDADSKQKTVQAKSAVNFKSMRLVTVLTK